MCARIKGGVSNGVNSYPSFVKGITVSTRTLYDSKTEVLDMSKCAGLKSFDIYIYMKPREHTVKSFLVYRLYFLKSCMMKMVLTPAI